ncbi:MAG: hypothetical protein ACR5LC_09600 [Symbiopectobacterium sp.]
MWSGQSGFEHKGMPLNNHLKARCTPRAEGIHLGTDARGFNDKE